MAFILVHILNTVVEHTAQEGSGKEFGKSEGLTCSCGDFTTFFKTFKLRNNKGDVLPSGWQTWNLTRFPVG
jgi:hypothetical protein